MDYSEVLTKMREIAERDGLDVQGPEAESKLLEAARKELEAEGEKCAQCEGKGEGEKCSACGPPMVEIAPAPLAGATTFGEADQYDEAQGVEDFAYRLQSRFRRIVDNIFSSDATLAEKAGKVKAAAGEMEDRLGKPPEPDNFFGRIKEKLGLGDKATKREDGKDFPASAYAYVPDATKPSTWKLRLTRTPGGGPDAGIVGAAIAALGKGFRGQKVQIPAADLAGVKAKVRTAWKKANPDKKPADMPAAIKEAGPGAFTAFKDAQGNWRWMTITSNIWRDRDGEIIPGDAHEGAVSYAERTKDMPDLRLWHVPGSRIGVADWVDFTHGFVLHSGSFDKGMEGAAASLAASKEPLGVSHGFYHNKDEDSDTYPWYRDFEVSVLPLEKAANQWTEFTADNTKEVAMGLSDERRGFLVEHIGEGRVTALEKLLEEKEEDLKSGKVDFKEVLAEAMEAAPAPDPKPAEGGGSGGTKGIEAELAKITELIGAQGKQIEEMATAAGEMGKDIKELERTDDEKIAAKMAPQRKPPADGETPTGSDGNVLTEAELEAKGINPEEALDSEKLEKTPGGRALKQIAGIK